MVGHVRLSRRGSMNNGWATKGAVFRGVLKTSSHPPPHPLSEKTLKSLSSSVAAITPTKSIHRVPPGFALVSKSNLFHVITRHIHKDPAP